MIGCEVDFDSWRFTMPERRIVKMVDNFDLAGACVRDVGRCPQLGPERQLALVEYVKEGWKAKEEFDRNGASPQKKEALRYLIERGKESRGQLMMTNFGLVMDRAKKHQGRGVELLDLVQEGFLKFDDAVKKFEPGKGYKFSTYLTWWIDQGIERSIYTNGRTIRRPERLATQINKISKIEDSLRQTLDRKPTDQEIMQAAGMTERIYKHVRKYQDETIISLDAATEKGERLARSTFMKEGHRRSCHFVLERPTEDIALAHIMQEQNEDRKP
jgi:RNA polymerase primary sigma factor